ncbi:hypothetical protein ACLOJK_037750 [Asimina triloba]
MDRDGLPVVTWIVAVDVVALHGLDAGCMLGVDGQILLVGVDSEIEHGRDGRLLAEWSWVIDHRMGGRWSLGRRRRAVDGLDGWLDHGYLAIDRVEEGGRDGFRAWTAKWVSSRLGVMEICLMCVWIGRAALDLESRRGGRPF